MKNDFVITSNFHAPSNLLKHYDLTKKIDDFNIYVKKKSDIESFENNDFYVISKNLLFEKRASEPSKPVNQWILEKYISNGKFFAKNIFGKFAIAIIEKKSKKLIYCTDHLGHYPIYYFCTKNIIISTNIQAFFSFIKKELDIEVLKDHLVQNTPRIGRTIYKNINVQEPGTCSLRDSKVHIHTKYHDFINQSSKNFSESEFKDIFLKVIDDQMSCIDGNISFSLSGGIDSSSIVCAANKKSKDKLMTHSATFPGSKADESFYINKVLSKISANHNDYAWVKFNYLKQLDRGAKLDEIAFGASTYINDAIYRSAKKNGSSAHFEGIFGDEVISHGYDRLIELGLSFQVGKLFREERRLRDYKNLKFSRIRSLKENLIKPLIPINIQRILLEKKKRSFIFPWLDIKNEKFNFCPVDHFIEINGYHPYLKDYASYKDNHLRSIKSPVIPYAARLYNNIGQDYDLELMSPFSDSRVIQYLLNVPLENKLKNGYERYFFRTAIRSILPKEIYMRKEKADLSPLFYKEISKIKFSDIEERVFFDGSPLAQIFSKNKITNYFSNDPNINQKVKLNNLHTILVLGTWIKEKFH